MCVAVNPTSTTKGVDRTVTRKKVVTAVVNKLVSEKIYFRAGLDHRTSATGNEGIADGKN